MSHFELVEDYLTNRLDDGARKSFEERMETDSELRAEVKFQQEIIEGVKSARVAELKAMLNNVPIGGASSAAVGKIALATISAGIIGTALYFGLRSTPSQDTNPEPSEVVIEQKLEAKSDSENKEQITSVPEEPKEPAEQKQPKGVRKMPDAKVVSPKVEVMDLTEDLKDASADTEQPKAMPKPTVTASTIEVEIGEKSNVYSFHYQFKEGKLVLYGPFDSSIYEIIEINGGTHTLFLYYKNSYYHLDNKEQNVAPLIMIRDFELLNKLEQYRKKN